MDLSIIIPAFEEEESLPELAEEIRSVCRSEGWSFEVWFVDDGSRDGTWETIERLHNEDPRMAGIRLRRNYGKSAALAAGFERAKGRYVATLDADLQDDPRELPGLVAKLEEGYDLVSGWKRERQDPLSKTIPSKFFNTVTRVVTGVRLHDFNCGLKVYRREVVKNLTLYGELHRYIPVLANWEGFDRITEKEVSHRPRRHGTTKFGLERFIRGFLDLISVLFLTRWAARPMHFFGGFGTLSFVTGFLISLYLTLDKIIYGNYLGDRPLLLLGLLLMLLGAQLFSTGLLGEMIISRRMEDDGAFEVQETREPIVREAA